MLLWTLWRLSDPSLCGHFFEIWSSEYVFFQPEPFGLMLMDNEWWKDVGWELDVLSRLHEVLPIHSVHRATRRLGSCQSLQTTPAHHSLQKVARLIDEVESEVTHGQPQAILLSCENFAKFKGQWLKVAGLEKAEILQQGLKSRPLSENEFMTEFGVYVGYTAVRLADLVAAHGFGRVVSLEVNPVHVCIARHLLDLGELAQVAEVKPGQAKDVLACVCEEHAEQSVGFSFMDHRGTIFHQDFRLLEKLAMPSRRSRFISDNTLNPGAPVFLWSRLHSSERPRILTVQWSLTEFLSDHEDWTAVSDMDAMFAEKEACQMSFVHTD
jgi:predicted O-methyltransferase YrrM